MMFEIIFFVIFCMHSLLVQRMLVSMLNAAVRSYGLKLQMYYQFCIISLCLTLALLSP